MNISEILGALNTLKGIDTSNTNDLRTLMADRSLEKAAGDMKAQDLKSGEWIHDHWTEGHMHRAPTREEIKVGHPQEASGGGLDRMIREYSNPAPQWSTVTTPEQLAAYLGDLHSALKSQGSILTDVITGMTSLKSVVVALATAKAIDLKPATATVKADEDEKEDDDEKEEVVEINEKSAKSLLAKAKALVRRLKTLKAEEKEEEKESEEAKALRAEIKATKKAASKVLAKARVAAYAAGSDDLKKSIRVVASKADIEVTQEENDDEEEESEADKAKKSETPAAAVVAAPATTVAPAATAATPATVEAKAKTDDKGNQADKQDPATGNQDDHAAKAVIDNALEGKIGMLQGTVNQLFDVITGKSKVADIVPDIAKSAAVKSFQFGDVLLSIDKARDNGQLNDLEAIACGDVVQRLQDVKDHGAPPALANDRYLKMPANARQWLEQRLAA